MDRHTPTGLRYDISDLDPDTAADRRAVVARRNEGGFWRACPGTTGGYFCCGYQVLTPVVGCGMYCRYCVLQAYFDHRCQVAFDNIDDLERETADVLKGHRGIVRVGTGEFSDSLFLDRRLGLSDRIAAILEPYPNVLVEFKTKSACIDRLSSIHDPSKVVVGFSVNPPSVISAYETDTAPLGERLGAAKRCEEMGFWVAFHFDPMVYYDGWEEGYRRLVCDIFSSVNDPARIAWWSLGAFRTMPALKKVLMRQREHLPLFAAEMVLGDDGKLRYFRPVRAKMFDAVRDEVERHEPKTTLYLCMENREVWQESAMIDRIPGGLVRYLDERAAAMLGMEGGV